MQMKQSFHEPWRGVCAVRRSQSARPGCCVTLGSVTPKAGRFAQVPLVGGPHAAGAIARRAGRKRDLIMPIAAQLSFRTRRLADQLIGPARCAGDGGDQLSRPASRRICGAPYGRNRDFHRRLLAPEHQRPALHQRKHHRDADHRSAHDIPRTVPTTRP